MEKTLVIYYSRRGENYVNGSITKINKGNTEYVAEFIKEIADADLFQIETVKKVICTMKMIIFIHTLNKHV